MYHKIDTEKTPKYLTKNMIILSSHFFTPQKWKIKHYALDPEK
jgi:hypothetical protein